MVNRNVEDDVDDESSRETEDFEETTVSKPKSEFLVSHMIVGMLVDNNFKCM